MLPDWLHGCILYSSGHAGPGAALVADCTVEGPASNRIRMLTELVDVIAEALQLTKGRPGIASYAAEDMPRLGYRISKANLSSGGEARIVEFNGMLLNAAAVLPGLELPASEPRIVGSPLHPPVPGSPLNRPSRQPMLERLPVYRAEPRPAQHPGRIVIAAEGRKVELSIDTLRRHAATRRLSLHCVTGWSTEKRWSVVNLMELIKENGLGAPASWLLATSSGGYTAVLPVEHLDDTWLALGFEGRPLPEEHGGPVRLIAPSLYGWKHVKWLTRIELLSHYTDGYWEARGYHELGRVNHEERFKLRNPRLADRLGHSPRW